MQNIAFLKTTMRKLFYLIILSFLTIPNVIKAQKIGILNREKTDKIDRLLNLYDTFGELSGVVFVAQDGKIIYKKAFGEANQEWKIDNTTDTKFRIGSLTKQFTAAIILQLEEEGKLKIKYTIADYLPYYRKDVGKKVTLHQLLNHTSGIPNYTNHLDFVNSAVRSHVPTEKLVTEYCSDDLEFQPGERFKYNDSGYAILGAIIEQVTGETFETNLKKRILSPLEMTDSGYDSPYTILDKRASGYQKVGFQYINAMFIDISIYNATGGMYSTVDDLYKWNKALNGEAILSKRAKKKMFSSNKIDRYGYGWHIEDTPTNINGSETTKAYHPSKISGFASVNIKLIEHNHTVIILSNSDMVPVNEIGEKLVATLYDLPYDLPRKSIIPIMLQSIEKQGIEVAIQGYKNLKIAQKDIWTIRVGELDDLGKELVKLDKIKAALAIFTLNIEEFPKSDIPSESLANYYEKKGEKEKALEYYRKALEINPNNSDVEGKIKSLEK
jgi:CubicO group peptidase (beta-lactamase class C family)